MTLRIIASVLLTLVGIAGSAVSVAMLISAVQFSEWGRVIFYCVTLAVSVELVVYNIKKFITNIKDV